RPSTPAEQSSGERLGRVSVTVEATVELGDGRLERRGDAGHQQVDLGGGEPEQCGDVVERVGLRVANNPLELGDSLVDRRERLVLGVKVVLGVGLVDRPGPALAVERVEPGQSPSSSMGDELHDQAQDRVWLSLASLESSAIDGDGRAHALSIQYGADSAPLTISRTAWSPGVAKSNSGWTWKVRVSRSSI